MTRKQLFDILDGPAEASIASKMYNYTMMVVIVMSLVPLAFKSDHLILNFLDKIAAAIFIVDYLLRFITADYKFGNKSFSAFAKYPFTPMALIDLISILPSLIELNPGLKTLRVLRMLRAMRVFRVFKVIRYSKSINVLREVFKASRMPLLAVGALVLGYILVAALVVFNVEPSSFDTIFDAIYWATISLTTIGYGDIYPVTVAGRVVTMLSSIFGIAIVALPAGIITAAYMSAINERIISKQDKAETKRKEDV